jgi:hypothetical protein
MFVRDQLNVSGFEHDTINRIILIYILIGNSFLKNSRNIPNSQLKHCNYVPSHKMNVLS